MENNLKFAFWGTPEVARNTLDILKASGFLPEIIITSLDARAGRGMKMQESPTAIFAKENGIPCLKPEKLDEAFYNELKPRCLEPNCLFIVVAYGKIIPENILNAPKLGSINIHYSLLPKYRGASPVESAILNSEEKTGVTIQKMVYKMDAGPILAQEETEILPRETAPELRERLIKIGGELLVKILPNIVVDQAKEIPQNKTQATYCKKIKKEDGLIDLSDLAVKPPSEHIALYNKFRAYADWPRTFFFKNGKRIIVTDAELKEGKFVIKKVLPEGKKEIRWEEFNRN